MSAIRHGGVRPAITVDLGVAGSWTRTRACPNDARGVPAVNLFVRAGETSDTHLVGIRAGERMRAILVDLGPGETLVVAIDSTLPGEFDSLVAEAMPIVESFRFAEQ